MSPKLAEKASLNPLFPFGKGKDEGAQHAGQGYEGWKRSTKSWRGHYCETDRFQAIFYGWENLISLWICLFHSHFLTSLSRYHTCTIPDARNVVPGARVGMVNTITSNKAGKKRGHFSETYQYQKKALSNKSCFTLTLAVPRERHVMAPSLRLGSWILLPEFTQTQIFPSHPPPCTRASRTMMHMNLYETTTLYCQPWTDWSVWSVSSRRAWDSKNTTWCMTSSGNRWWLLLWR